MLSNRVTIEPDAPESRFPIPSRRMAAKQLAKHTRIEQIGMSLALALWGAAILMAGGLALILLPFLLNPAAVVSAAPPEVAVLPPTSSPAPGASPTPFAPASPTVEIAVEPAETASGEMHSEWLPLVDTASNLPADPLEGMPSPTPTAFLPSPITPLPPPTDVPTATPPPPANSARIENIYGYVQSLSLSCESRSAVDWARYFGVSIGELEFLNQLPRTDNPETGFVGDPNGWPGQTPPGPYGVHAPPVAALLRAYGLPAQEHRLAEFELIRQQVSQGNPVMVWVISSVVPGYGQWYTASDGQSTLVAPLEHTVLVIGYTEDTVTVLDNARIYSRPLGTFLISWGALGNQAITYSP